LNFYFRLLSSLLWYVINYVIRAKHFYIIIKEEKIMACFIVPMVEAVVTTAVTKVVKKKESENVEMNATFSRKLGWLNNMLWGGSALLAFEHAWHGEIIPQFPFLTNAINAADRVTMLNEMSTVGVGMAVAVTIAWAVAAVATTMIEKNSTEQEETVAQEV
jgi:hypothetical protein